jgi:hypothetical protein
MGSRRRIMIKRRRSWLLPVCILLLHNHWIPLLPSAAAAAHEEAFARDACNAHHQYE